MTSISGCSTPTRHRPSTTIPPPASSTKTGPTATTSRLVLLPEAASTPSSSSRSRTRTRPRAATPRPPPTRAASADSTLNLSAQFQRIGSLFVQPGDGSAPTVNISSVLTSLGTASTIPIDRAENRYRYGALLRRNLGAHSLTFGGGLARRQTNGFEADTHRGSISFGNAFGNDAITNFRLGLPNTYFIAIGDVHRGYRDWSGEIYFGDHWRASTKLDLSVGLRYELMGAPSEVNHLDPVPYDCDCNNLAPTFGFAYRLPPSLGLIRAAFGIHYATLLPVTYQQGRYNAPGNVKQIIQQPNLVDPLAGFDPSNLAGVQSVRYNLDPELAAPYSMQYNFSWELEPSRGWNLSLGYVGSRSPKLLSQWYLNRAELVDGIPATLATVNERRLDTSFAEERRI
ncbi:MAG: TonB-dependent receptor [Bryobacterales bacterium]